MATASRMTVESKSFRRTVKVLMLLTPLIVVYLPFCVSPVNAAAVAPQRHELAYDDGTAESSVALPYAEFRWVR